jgi:hypothetical protein
MILKTSGALRRENVDSCLRNDATISAMPGLDPGIHVFLRYSENMDGRA